MRLSTHEAFLVLFHFTSQFSGEIEKTMKMLKSEKYSAQLLSTGAKLRYDSKSFYLSSYDASELDILPILDFLDILDDYWVYLEVGELLSSEDIERRKLVYQGYKDAQNMPSFEADKEETDYLLSSPTNADYIKAAIEQAKSRTLKPQTIDELFEELESA